MGGRHLADCRMPRNTKSWLSRSFLLLSRGKRGALHPQMPQEVRAQGVHSRPAGPTSEGTGQDGESLHPGRWPGEGALCPQALTQAEWAHLSPGHSLHKARPEVSPRLPGSVSGKHVRPSPGPGIAGSLPNTAILGVTHARDVIVTVGSSVLRARLWPLGQRF